MKRSGMSSLAQFGLPSVSALLGGGGLLLLEHFRGLTLSGSLLILLGALAVNSLGFMVIHRRRVRAVDTALGEIQRKKKIDLSFPIEPELSGVDQRIGATVDTLTYSLNAVVLEIITASKKFSLFSADIYYSGEHLSELSERQAEFIDRVLQRAEEFEGQVSGLVSLIGEIVEKVEGNSRRYEELREKTQAARRRLDPLSAAAEEAGNLATAGVEQMERSLQAISDLTPAISGLDSRLNRMEEQTSQIGSLLAKIEDVAESSHVLAMNAAVEAARAGSAGNSFAVIATEMRQLTANTRSAITEVTAFLTDTARDIRESAKVAQSGAAQLHRLKAYSEETGESLKTIAERVAAVSRDMGGFREMFGEQTETIEATIIDAEGVHKLIDEVGSAINLQARGYAEIRKEVSDAAAGARSAAHSARVLSQLGTYLRTGGQELSHIVEVFTTSEPRFLQGLERKEPRTTLLYNLEVFKDGSLLGHLGDISPSGLMIYTGEPLPVGEPQAGQIHLPLSFGEETDIPIRFVPRRNEAHSWFYKVGCSIDEESSRRQRDDIERIINNFTITQGLDTLSQIGGAANQEGETLEPAELEPEPLEPEELEPTELEPEEKSDP